MDTYEHKREGLTLRTQQGDMRDLSAFSRWQLTCSTRPRSSAASFA